MNDKGETTVCLAAQLDDHEGAAKLVNILLQSEFNDLGLPDDSGKTRLQHAVLECNLDVCKLPATRIDGGLSPSWKGKGLGASRERGTHSHLRDTPRH